jgi:hypothetical protein
MEGRRFERFGEEGRKGAWEKRRGKGREMFSPLRERKERRNEIFWPQNHLNILPK